MPQVVFSPDNHQQCANRWVLQIAQKDIPKLEASPDFSDFWKVLYRHQLRITTTPWALEEICIVGDLN